MKKVINSLWITLWTTLVVFLLGLSFAQGASVKRPDAPPLSQRGTFSVGVKTLQITDASRKRSITAEVWYPTQSKDGPIAYDTVIGQTPVKVEGRAKRDAAPLAGKFPLIVASHGQPGTRYQFAYLSEHLASYGFVVANLDHPGSTYQTLTQESYVTSIADRPLDVLFAVGEIAKQITSADGNTVGLMGYSYGGYSVINAAGAGLDSEALAEYCKANGAEGPCFAQNYFSQLEPLRGSKAIKSDPRIKAVFAMAPYGQPWIGAKSLSGLKLPLFVAAGDADDVATYKRDPLEYFKRAGSAQKYLLTLAAAQHNPFAECPPQARANPTDYERCSEPVWDMERAHDIVMHFATAFFTLYLKDNKAASLFLNPSLGGFKPRTTVGVKLETK